MAGVSQSKKVNVDNFLPQSQKHMNKRHYLYQTKNGTPLLTTGKCVKAGCTHEIHTCKEHAVSTDPI
jgi:hypothetical protein